MHKLMNNLTDEARIDILDKFHTQFCDWVKRNPCLSCGGKGLDFITNKKINFPFICRCCGKGFEFKEIDELKK